MFISFISYRLLINGQPSICFYPERGLYQGEPLFLYLFIIYAEVLSGILKKEELSKIIHGMQVARKAIIIFYLFFTYDNLLFARANVVEANQIIQVLSRYQKSYGQVVNIDKYEVSFSGNMGDDSKEMIHNRLDFKAVIRHLKYICLPVVFSR